MQQMNLLMKPLFTLWKSKPVSEISYASERATCNVTLGKPLFLPEWSSVTAFAGANENSPFVRTTGCPLTRRRVCRPHKN
ncbi:hypothetical protein BIW11_10294 [Tropilaelaps mercedesae]|uniref:Uncharacterized protein n=1 Tax=Tropilaelaps mercedesae TaxID=418985 RepID=A0A1V9XGS5_9ACAR|nr:hypothetical protein BIW11_10294 [Tropilaelaps mercedesae]